MKFIYLGLIFTLSLETVNCCSNQVALLYDRFHTQAQDTESSNNGKNQRIEMMTTSVSPRLDSTVIP